MSPTRRDFIKATTSTAAALAVGRHLALDPAAQTLPAPSADAAAIELANDALNAARGAGASYADVRIGRYRRQQIATRERQVTGVTDTVISRGKVIIEGGTFTGKAGAGAFLRRSPRG